MRSWYELENADEVPSPGLMIFPDRVRKNLLRMVDWAGADRLRPHVKTHKLPQIIQMKLDVGITKFKVATIAEAEMTAATGGRDVFVAYQMAGPNRQRLIDLMLKFPATKFSTLADDPAVVRALSAEAIRRDIQLDVFVDLNVGMNRTGIAPGVDAIDLYRLIASADGLRAAGFHVYDGHIHDADEASVRQQITQAFEPVWKMKRELQAMGIPVPTIVAGGTVSSPILIAEQEVEVSAGTSVLWDAGQPTFTPPMEVENAAVLIARVISRPSENLICIDLGYKAVASEMQPPRVTLFGLEDATMVSHSEEHMVLRTGRAEQFPVDTVLYGIPTHICPTVALYGEVWCVQDQRAIQTWPVVARARRISV